MIFILVAILLVLFSFKDFKKAFLLFMLYKLILNTNINFLSIPGVPILSVEDVLIMVFIMEFYARKQMKTDLQGYNNFPFRIPFILIVISWTISTIFAYVGFGIAVSAYVKNILEYIIMTFLMWRTINTKEDLEFLLKGFTILFLCFGFYELYEIVTNTNPLSDYELTLVTDASKAIDFGNYEDEIDRGFRAKSVFTHPIGAGINFSLYIIIALFFLMRTKIDLKVSKFLIIVTSLLSLVCIIMTKSRGPYVFLLIGSFTFINLKSSQFYKYSIVFFFALLLLLPYFSDQFEIFKSIYDSKSQASVGGSSVDMRFEQLVCAIALMSMSPIYGLGYKYLNVISNFYTMGLLGGESIWFSVLPQYGLIGIIAYIFMIYWVIIKLPQRFKSSSIFFVSLAYWIVNTTTSTPGMQVYLYYLSLILFMKYKMGAFGAISEKEIISLKRCVN